MKNWNVRESRGGENTVVGGGNFVYLCERISKQLKHRERKLNKNNAALLTLESAVSFCP
jgi:hypothetical protein